MKRAISPEEREYLLWLKHVEGRAILLLKWIMLIVTLVIWLWSTGFAAPATEIFMLFFLYAMFNVAQTYFFHFSRVQLNQIKGFCYASYFVDVLFVTALVYFDTSHYVGRTMQSDFYILYFLLILRGFALFRTARENLLMNLLICVLFILSVRLQERSVNLLGSGMALKFALIWMVILMSWFIVEIINKQKAELLKARERLIRSEQMATLGELAAGVAHEINNPIGIISAYSEYLLKNAGKKNPLSEDYEIIHKEAMRCERIVSDLLNFATPSVKEIAECDIRQLNDEVVKFLFHEKEDGRIQVEKHYASNIPMVLADPVQLKQALLNIYLNARQAIEGEGMIDVTIEPSSKDENSVWLAIGDTGKGIDEDDLERVFEPFFTRKKGGTGLGLTITQRIIEAHQGRIVIKRRKPRGTLVEILLPGKE